MSTSGGGFLRAARAWRHLAACRRPGRGPRTVRAKTVGWRSRLDKRRAPDVRPPQLNAGSAPRPHAMRAPPAAPGRGAGGAPPDTPGDYSPRPESRAPRYLKVGTDPQALRGPFAMRLRRLPLAALIASVCAASFTGCNCGSTRGVAPPLPPPPRRPPCPPPVPALSSPADIAAPRRGGPPPLPPLSAVVLTPATDTLN